MKSALLFGFVFLANLAGAHGAPAPLKRFDCTNGLFVYEITFDSALAPQAALVTFADQASGLGPTLWPVCKASIVNGQYYADCPTDWQNQQARTQFMINGTTGVWSEYANDINGPQAVNVTHGLTGDTTNRCI